MIPLNAEKQFFFDTMRYARKAGVGYQELQEGEQPFDGRLLNIRGHEFLNFANCCYLGLETHPDIKAGTIRATEKFGSLLSNSRSYFSSPLYSQLEALLDKMLPGYQVVTTTTTLGHCSTLPVMIDAEDAIILDQYAHNSIRMAAQLCQATGTKMAMTRNNDYNHLQKVIKRLQKQNVRNIWYLADGLYSMQGEFIKLKELKDLLNQYEHLYTYIDDAHGFSWTGKNGAGYVMGNGEIHPKMIVAVSMCKSFGAFGGIISFPNKEWAERVRLLGQTLIFSAPISPPILGAAIASAKLHMSDNLPGMQQELLEKIRYFRSRCKALNIPLKTKDETPVQFIEVGDNNAVYALNQHLQNKGIYVTSAIYPAMPKKHGGIRVSITRHLTLADLDYFIDQFRQLDLHKYRDVTAHTVQHEPSRPSTIPSTPLETE